MTKLVEWRVFLATVGILAAVALGISYVLGLSFLPIFLVTVGAVFVNAILATLEDDLPGGFNNPDGTATPAYASRAAAVGRWVLAIALVAFGAEFVRTGLSAVGPAALPFLGGIAGACILFSFALFFRRRWLLYAALLSGFGGIALQAAIR